MVNFYAFGICAAFVACLAALSRSRLAALGAMVVVGNWMIWSGFIILTNASSPWQFGIAMDGLCAWLLLRSPSCRAKSMLAGLYCAQISMHVALGIVALSGFSADYAAYNANLDAVGWLQLLVVGGWSGVDFGRRALRLRRLSRRRIHAPHSGDLGRGQ